MKTPSAFIHLHPDDNVYVLIRTLPAGEVLEIDGAAYSFEQSLSLGHKIACRDISAGEKILKYGMSIGLATEAIACGQHVHLHNLESEYTHTFTLDEARRYG
ncbi:MAG: UxaA family hydrolase [Opitutaceae bacterium]